MSFLSFQLISSNKQEEKRFIVINSFLNMAFKIPFPPPKEVVVIPEDPSLPKFSYSELSQKESLGRGSFGTTFKANFRGDTVAVKFCKVFAAYSLHESLSI